MGFALVWVALAIFTWDALHHARRTRLANAAATAVADDPLASVAQASS
jgi:hypothetical protein